MIAVSRTRLLLGGVGLMLGGFTAGFCGLVLLTDAAARSAVCNLFSSPEKKYVRGMQLFKGEGVPADVEAAVALFHEAAEAGHVEAQRCLGVMYEEGKGVSRDEAEAVKWYRLAAEQGDAAAIKGLKRLK